MAAYQKIAFTVLWQTAVVPQVTVNFYLKIY